MCDNSFVVNKESLVNQAYVRKLGQETIQLYRHYTGHEPWPGLELDLSVPGQV